MLHLVWKILRVKLSLVRALLAVFFGFLAIYAFTVWRQSVTPTFSNEPLYDYLHQIQELRDSGKYGEAIALGNFVATQPDLPHHTQIVAIKNDIVKEQASYFGKSKRFVSGFVTGDTTSIEGMIGTAISDFLLIGDIRDLSKQGYNVVAGEEVDAFVTALAAVGLVASVATFIPTGATNTAGAGSKPVLSLLKALKRVGALSDRLTAKIFQLAQEAVRTHKLGAFRDVITTFGGLAKRAPRGTLPTLTKHTESLDEAATLLHWVNTAPNETVTLMLLKGREGVAILPKMASSPSPKETLVYWLRYGGKVRTPIRATKFIFRGRIGDIQSALTTWLLNAPSARWFALSLSAISALLCLGNGVLCLARVYGFNRLRLCTVVV